VPSILGYVKKANIRADMANAKIMHDEVISLVFTDTAVYDTNYNRGQLLGQVTPYDSFYLKNPDAFTRTVNEPDGTTSTYKIRIVAKMDGASNGARPHRYTWDKGSDESLAFTSALNQLENNPSPNNAHHYACPIRNKSLNGDHLNRWYICYRDDNKEAIEIWVGDADNKSKTYTDGHHSLCPLYRLYPPCDEYK
jgi:hypothetical protein